MHNNLMRFLFSLTIGLFLSANAMAQCNTIDFSASKTTGCAPLPISFTAQNIPASAKVEWDLGGGFVNGTDTAFRIFTTSGQKTVKLRITLSGQSIPCTTITKTNIINVLPKPDINLWQSDTLLCAGASSVQFIDSTLGVAQRTWIFNGNTESTTGTTITKNVGVGNHSINLIVKNSFGCESVYRDNYAVGVYNSIDIEICGKLVETNDETTGNFSGNILNSTFKPDSFRWVFEDASPSTSTSSNPKGITWSSPVTEHEVTMYMIFPGGCKFNFSKSDFVEPFLSVDDDTACVRQELEISNLAADNGRQDFSMSFPGANYKGGNVTKKFTITYVSTGSKDLVYSYKYSGHDDACETSVRAKDLVFIEGPLARAFSNDKNKCTLDSLLIQSNSAVPSTGDNLYTWSIFDDDSNMIKPTPLGPTKDLKSFKIKFDTFGVYNLALKVENTGNGCVDSALFKNYIRNIPPAADVDFSDTLLCADDNLTLEDATQPPSAPGNPYKYNWLIKHNDSSNITFQSQGKKVVRTLKMPGKYKVRLIVESNKSCIDTLIKEIEVRGILGEVLVDSTKGCPGFETTVDVDIELIYPDTSNPNYVYAWDAFPKEPVTYGDSTLKSTTVKFDEANCYSATLYVNDVHGCKKELESPQICIGVEANFGWEEDTLAQLCLNEEFPLVDSSKYAVAEYRWSVDNHRGLDFTDSTSRFSKIIFREAGTFKIQQWVSSGAPANCVDSITRTIVIEAPEAKFKVDKPLTKCAPQQITFTNESKNANGFTWLYGDGGIGTNASTDHIYVYTTNNIAGFTPKLVAFKVGSEQCADTFEYANKVRIIGPTPEYSADKLFGCDTVEVEFFNLTAPINADYVFDYGDGSAPDSNKIRKHTYTYNSTANEDSVLYFPTIIASSFGCDAFYTDTITVYKSPTANFSFDTLAGCRPLTVTLVQNNTKYRNFHWDLWNDSTIDSINQDTVVWTIDTVGKFGASIYATVGQCSSVFGLDSSFEVGRAPLAGFSLSTRQGCDTQTVFFSNNTTPTSANFVIDYGDGSKPDTNIMSSHLYSIPATYPDDSIIYYPRLTASSFGCDNVVEDTVVIYRAPSVSISIDSSIGCQPFDAVLLATVSSNFGYQWDLYSDGIIDTQDVASWPITLDTFGYFDVTVSANYRGGCVTTVKVDSIVRVVDLPQPGFTMDVTQGCDSFSVSFNNTTSPAFTSYSFDYGDGFLVSDTIVEHKYKFSGLDDSIIYTPRIVGTRVLCNAEFADSVIVYKSPTADFTIDTTYGCEPMQFELLSTSTNNFKLEWDVFNDTTIEKVNSDTLLFSTDSVGQWPVRLWIEYVGGCTSSKVVDSLFRIYRMPVADILFDTTSSCDSLSATFTTNNPNDSFIINYGNGLTDTNITQTASYYFPLAVTKDSAEFYVNYTVFNPLLAACSHTQIDTLVVFKSPTASFVADTLFGCTPMLGTFTNTSARAVKTFWDFDADSLSDDTLITATDTFSAGKQTIGLVIESVEGCRDTLYKKDYLTVYNTPEVDFTASRVVSCANDPIQFNDISKLDTLVAFRKWNFSTSVNPDFTVVPSPAIEFPAAGEYQITLSVTDSNFCTSADTSSIEIINVDTPDFVNPLSLTTSIVSGNSIAWNASSLNDFESYTLIRVYKDDSVGVDVSGTAFSDPIADFDELAIYRLMVTDSCGNRSFLSPHLSRLVIGGDNKLDNVLKVNWDYIGWNNWQKFLIHRRYPSSSTWNLIDSVTDPLQTQFLDSTACDSGYVYRVEGITKYGASSMSNEIALTSQFSKKTSALQLYTVSVQDNKMVRLDYEKNQHPGQRKYVIDRAGNDRVWQIEYDSSFASFYYDSLANFKDEYYHYRVYMLDYCGNRNPVSNEGTSIALLGNGQNGNVNLRWNQYLGWPTEYSFELQIKYGNNGFKKLASFNDDGLSYVDYEIHSELDTPWCYRIAAIQKSGRKDSVFSNYYCDYLTDSIYVPNAFSPNDDGVNDYFIIGGEILKRDDLGTLQSYNLKIFDRWGERLFETNNPKVDWDGKKAGITVPLGQYLYILELVDENGEESIETGPVFVIK
ncbi:MAG: gliding motility-associated C-terminal domain-containing protein [Bacteroidia bacterium]